MQISLSDSQSTDLFAQTHQVLGALSLSIVLGQRVGLTSTAICWVKGGPIGLPNCNPGLSCCCLLEHIIAAMLIHDHLQASGSFEEPSC